MIPMFMFFQNSTTSGTPYVGGDWVFSTDYASLALAVATGKNVFIPENTTHTVTSLIQLAVNQMLVGANVYTSKIISNFNGKAIWGEKGVRIYNIWFEGAGRSAGLDYNGGIMAKNTDWDISGNIFTKFSGNELAGMGGGGIQCLGGEGTYTRGATCSNNIFDNNVCGINIMEVAEFIRFTNNNFFNNGVAVSNRGGNNTFTTGIMTSNTVGFLLAQGSNSGHGSISDYRINHNTTNIKINDQALGFNFTNVHSYDGHIEITNSNDITFGNCHLVGYSGNTFTLNGNTANGVRIDGLTKFNVSTYTKLLTGNDYILV